MPSREPTGSLPPDLDAEIAAAQAAGLTYSAWVERVLAVKSPARLRRAGLLAGQCVVARRCM